MPRELIILIETLKKTCMPKELIIPKDTVKTKPKEVMLPIKTYIIIT
jgi:hypothetical protein